MRGRATTILLTIALTGALTARALAWGGEGHQIVALIAERHLNDQARAGIRELLGEGVNISDAEICNWADQIRRERRNTAPWHYVNIPLDVPALH